MSAMSDELDDLLDDLGEADESVPEPDPEPEAAPEPPVAEADIILPPPTEMTLSSGIVVEFEELKARQFFRMLRILTRGAADVMAENPIDFGGDEQTIAIQVASLLVFAIPEAEDETIDFIKSMVKPAGLEPGRDKASRDRNEKKYAELDAELDNPELNDLLDLVNAIIQREAADLGGLGKRLRSLFETAAKAGQMASQPAGSASSKKRSRTAAR